MNKKLSRIAAIALSAAMVTSAFAMSTSASFAATAAPTVTADPITFNAVFDSAHAGTPVALSGASSVFGATPTATVKLGNGTASADLTVDTTSYKITSGTAAKVSGTNLVPLAPGTVTVTATAAVANNKDVEYPSHNKKFTFTDETNKVTVTATVHVYENGTYFVTPNAAGAPSATVAPTTSYTASMNEEVKTDLYEVTAKTPGTDATAQFAAPTTLTAVDNGTFTNNNATNFPFKAAPLDADTSATIAAQDATNVHTGTFVVGYDINKDGSLTPADKVEPLNLTVDDSYTTVA